MRSIKDDEKYMQRSLELGMNGSGYTSPNPMVGSVIVYQDKIIGEGYHVKYGESHAEINAIESVKDKSLLKESTLYVNLEPCAHYGNTPPCANKIVEAGIPKVVIGTRDTSGKVSGKGIKIMEEGGIDVRVGVLEEQCRDLNKRFFTYHEKQRPYIILKWAQTIDKFIDKIREPEDPIQPNWITNQVSKRLVHKWRTQEQAILVGSKTAIKDDPSLTVREWSGKNPLRILIDKDFEINNSYRLVHDEFETIIFVDKKVYKNRLDKYSEYNVTFEKVDFSERLMEQLLQYLFDKEIQSIIIEGGAITLSQFLNNNLWDEARIFIGDRMFYEGVEAPYFPEKKLDQKFDLKSTKLYILRNS